MSKKISFTDSLHRYFDPTFNTLIRDYVSSGRYSKDKGISPEQAITFNELRYYNVCILDVDGTIVRFFVKFTFFCEGLLHAEENVSCICSWDIPLKENGLTIGPLQVDAKIPEAELTYGDDLVPIVSAEQYPLLALLFRRKVFNDVRFPSVPFLYAQECIDKLGLKVKSSGLPSTCTGKIIMADTVMQFKNNDGTISSMEVLSGTIICDYVKAASTSQGLLTSTLLHECFHWVFHRGAFELGRLYCKDDKGFTCLKGDRLIIEGARAAEGSEYIEIQTNGAVPYITVSREQLRNEANSMFAKYRNSGFTIPMALEKVLFEMKNVHGFTLNTIRRCLVESGMQSFRGICLCHDGHFIQSYCWGNRDYLGKDETFFIAPDEAKKLCLADAALRTQVIDGDYFYLDCHFVLNEPKYIDFLNPWKPSISRYALSHADECFRKFKVRPGKGATSVRYDYGFDRVSDKMKAVYEAMNDNTLSFIKQSKANSQWREYIRSWNACKRGTFRETLLAILEFRGIKDSYFDDGYGVSQTQIQRICDGTTRVPNLRTVVVIAGYLDMPYEVALWFFSLAGYNFHEKSQEMEFYSMYLSDKPRFETMADVTEELNRRKGKTS